MRKNITAKEKSFLENMVDLETAKLSGSADEIKKYKEKYGCDPCDTCGPTSCSDCKACAQSIANTYSNPFDNKY